MVKQQNGCRGNKMLEGFKPGIFLQSQRRCLLGSVEELPAPVRWKKDKTCSFLSRQDLGRRVPWHTWILGITGPIESNQKKCQGIWDERNVFTQAQIHNCNGTKQVVVRREFQNQNATKKASSLVTIPENVDAWYEIFVRFKWEQAVL